MSRRYPQHPVVAVGAVLLEGTSVLLAKRGRNPGLGQWSLPGGAVEVGETLAEAITREVREEASVQIEVGGVVGIFDRIVPDAAQRIRYHYVLVDFWGWIVSGTPTAGSDIHGLKWVAIKDLEPQGVEGELKEAILAGVRLRDDWGAAG